MGFLPMNVVLRVVGVPADEAIASATLRRVADAIADEYIDRHEYTARRPMPRKRLDGL
jgi:hypothetical protein